ncbi:unnamed protein product, partial [Musa acuminata subsp. burmannicoides]
HGSLGPVDVSECDSVDREGCADDLVGEEKGAERRGARRQSTFVFLEPHRLLGLARLRNKVAAILPLHRFTAIMLLLPFTLHIMCR